MFDSLGRLFAAQPIFTAAVVLVLLMMLVGLRIIIARYAGERKQFDWRKDPDALRDLSPALKRARIIMSVSAGVMISLFILGIATMFTGTG